MVNKISPRIGFSMGKVVDFVNGKTLIPANRDTNGNLISMNRSSQLGKDLTNALKTELTNDVGGYQIPIDTLTQIAREVTTQVFYSVPITEYLPVVIGQGAFSQSLLTFKTGSTGNQFKQNIFRSGQNSSLTQANTQIQGDTIEILNFAQGMTYSLVEMKQAAMYGNFDLIAAKEEARKTVYDQGLIQTAFLGVPEFGQGFYGLVNQDMTQPDRVPVDAGVTINKPIGTMNELEINALVGALIYKYYSNTGFSKLPSRFIIPTSDYFTLQEYINPAFPLADSQRINILLKAFKSQTGNEKFEIKHTIYCQKTESDKINGGLAKDRYILTVDDPKSLKMLLPVPYTVTLANTINGYEWQNAAYGQFSTVQLLRGKETQYYDLP